MFRTMDQHLCSLLIFTLLYFYSSTAHGLATNRMEIGADARSPPPRVDNGSNPAHFVLIHGASHGAWCWYKVRNLLEGSGHRVTCIDLLSGGIDPTPATAVDSFDDYNRPLDALLLSPDGAHAPAHPHRDIILVGHSAGCLSVTRAIHNPLSASRLAAAVYIAGWMLRRGYYSPPERNNSSRRGLPRGRNGVLPEEYQRLLLYNKSPPEDTVLASMLLRPSPGESVFLGAQWEGGGQWVDDVNRVFVKTSGDDRVFNSSSQEQTVETWPPSMVFQVDSDHSPFFSTPQELSDVLLQVAADRGFSGPGMQRRFNIDR